MKSEKRLKADQQQKLSLISDKLTGVPDQELLALAKIVKHGQGKYDSAYERQLSTFRLMFDAPAQLRKDREVLGRLVDRAHEFLTAHGSDVPWTRSELLASVSEFWNRAAYGSPMAPRAPETEPDTPPPVPTLINVDELQDRSAETPRPILDFMASRAVFDFMTGCTGKIVLEPGNEYSSALALLRERYGLEPAEIALWALHRTGFRLPIDPGVIDEHASKFRSAMYHRKQKGRPSAEDAARRVMRETLRRKRR